MQWINTHPNPPHELNPSKINFDRMDSVRLNSQARLGSPDRPGRSEPRPGGSPWGGKSSDVLVMMNPPVPREVLGTVAGAAARPNSTGEFGLNRRVVV